MINKLKLSLVASLLISSSLMAQCEIDNNLQASNQNISSVSKLDYDFDFSNLQYGTNVKTTDSLEKGVKIDKPIKLNIHTLKESSYNKTILQNTFEALYTNVEVNFVNDKESKIKGRLYPFVEVQAELFPTNFEKLLVKEGDSLLITNFALRKYFKIKDSYFQEEIYNYEKDKVTDNFFSAYVMSHCPYGINAQKTMVEQWKAGKIKPENIDFRYVVLKNKYGFQSLNGEKELDENARQLYVKDKLGRVAYFKYLDVFLSSNGDYNKALEQFNLTNEDIFKDMSYIGELLQIEAIYTEKNGVTASPTFLDRNLKKINLPTEIK